MPSEDQRNLDDLQRRVRHLEMEVDALRRVASDSLTLMFQAIPAFFPKSDEDLRKIDEIVVKANEINDVLTGGIFDQTTEDRSDD